MSLAIATNTAPRQWWDEDDATIATALAVLDRMSEEAQRGT